VRICAVVPYDLSEQGGVKRHAFQLATELRALGDEVTVLGASSEPSSDPEVKVFGGIVNLRSNGSENRLAVFAPPWRIRRWLREGAFDVVHIHEPLCPLLAPWAALFTRGAALVATFHAFAEREPWTTRMLRRWTAPLVLRRFQRAIAVSEPAATYARAVWKRDLAIIPNGISTELFRRAPPTRGPWLGPVRLLFVGHWRDERKGLPTLLAAVTALRARDVAVTLDVVGSGPAGVPAPEVPGVRFHGPADDEAAIAGHLQACDVFVAPSTGQESFGIVLLEAMAAGRAIVCSDIPGYRQVVGPDNARLVSPGSADELAAAIEHLATRPAERRAMADANPARAEAFAWTTLVHRVRGEYLGAVAERDRRVAAEVPT